MVMICMDLTQINLIKMENQEKAQKLVLNLSFYLKHILIIVQKN